MQSGTKANDLTQNLVLANKLRDLAELLRQQAADGYRVAAYERAAATIQKLDRPVADIFAEGGREGLIDLPSVGHSIAAALVEMLATGRCSQLERLRGALEPEKLFQTLPGIGPGLARSIHEELHVEDLRALEAAAFDGRLAQVTGIGLRRQKMIQAALGERLGRPRLRKAATRQPAPPAALVLDIDREYREKAKAGALAKIAPKRFNPTGGAWLPIMHAERDSWRFTALFSNSRLAHELGRLDDWVIVHFEDEQAVEGQCAVVSEIAGPLKGMRVIRGREAECAQHYAALTKR